MRHPTLCVIPTCVIPGRHTDDCERPPDCRGCLPATARDGLRLCGYHTDGIARDAVNVAKLHAELAHRLVGGGTGSGASEVVAVSRDPGLRLHDGVGNARHHIRNALTTWVRIVTDERGLTLPTVDVPQALSPGFIGPPRLRRYVDNRLGTLGALIARHAVWLAASPYADEVATELHDLAATGRRLAYPSGTRSFAVAPCPQVADGSPCAGQVRAVVRATDALLPSALVCDADDTHTWPASAWRQLGRAIHGHPEQPAVAPVAASA